MASSRGCSLAHCSAVGHAAAAAAASLASALPTRPTCLRRNTSRRSNAAATAVASTSERVSPCVHCRDAEVRVDAPALCVGAVRVAQCAADLPNPCRRRRQGPAEEARGDCAVDHPRLGFLYVMAAQCCLAGRPEAAVGCC